MDRTIGYQNVVARMRQPPLQLGAWSERRQTRTIRVVPVLSSIGSGFPTPLYPDELGRGRICCGGHLLRRFV